MAAFNTNELHKAQRYDEIIGLWSDEGSRGEMNEWDWWYCLLSYNKLRRYTETLEAFRKMYAEKRDSQDPEVWKRIYYAAGWALYYTYIKAFDTEHGDRNKLYRQVDFIVEKCQDPTYSPLVKTVMLISKWMKDRKLGQMPDYRRMSRYLSAVNPSSLSEEENIGPDEKPYASDRELWYMRQSKALLETKQYEACIQCVDDALIAVSVFHNNDDAWLHMNKGDALMALDRFEEARKEFKTALLDLQDWNLYLRLFRVEAREGNVGQALYYGARCGLSAPFSPEQDDKRIRFYTGFADYLAQQGMVEEAQLHRRHALHIYAANPIWKVHSDWQIQDELMALDRKQTARKLSDFWKQLAEQHTQWKTGRIERLFPGDKAGLIEDGQHNRVFFAVRDYLGKRTDVTPGLRVSFATEMRRNRKKGTVEMTAVMIEKAEE